MNWPQGYNSIIGREQDFPARGRLIVQLLRAAGPINSVPQERVASPGTGLDHGVGGYLPNQPNDRLPGR